jgi:hypothetical protein
MPTRPTSALPCRSALVSRIPKPGRRQESAGGGPESALALYPAYGLRLAPAGHGDRDHGLRFVNAQEIIIPIRMTPLRRLCGNSHRNHMIGAPGGAIMTTPVGSVTCKGPRSRRQLQGIPENFSLCLPPVFKRWPRFSHRIWRGLRRSGHLADSAMAAWQMHYSGARRTVASRRALPFTFFLQYRARPLSLAALLSHPLRRGLHSVSVLCPMRLPTGDGAAPGFRSCACTRNHNTPV